MNNEHVSPTTARQREGLAGGSRKTGAAVSQRLISETPCFSGADRQDGASGLPVWWLSPQPTLATKRGGANGRAKSIS